MPLQFSTLSLACVSVLVMSAGFLALFGLTSRTYRGYGWWVAAQALLACGIALAPQADGRGLALLPLANLLALQWPVTMLIGLRRFYSRHEWQVPAWVDSAMLAAAFGAWFLSWAAGAEPPMRALSFGIGSIALSSYTLWLVVLLRGFRHTVALGMFALTIFLGAAHQGFRILVAAGAPDSPTWREPVLFSGALLLILTSLAVIYIALLLTTERTEANLLVMQRKLRVLADMDPLTGLANRRHFLDSSTEALLQPESHGRCAVLMFDIDHFKRINDLLGHATGDEALRQIALCVQETLRERDVAGRLGGDEFAVLLPDTSVGDAMTVASRIVSLLDYRQVAPQTAPLSLSFGVVQARRGEPIGEALKRADLALYEAKRQGRSRAVSASGDLDELVFGASRPMGLGAR